MSENENKNRPQTLDDSILDQVTGGAGDEVDLDEHRLPGGWLVTCCNCATVFPANKGACPNCGGKYVYMRY